MEIFCAMFFFMWFRVVFCDDSFQRSPLILALSEEVIQQETPGSSPVYNLIECGIWLRFIN